MYGLKCNACEEFDVIITTPGMLNKQVKRAEEVVVGVENEVEQEQQVDMNVWYSGFDTVAALLRFR